jgi:hypothetical protein
MAPNESKVSARDGETVDMLPARGRQSAPTIHQVNRRPFGIGPVPLLGGGLLAVIVVAAVLFALGSWIPGIILLAGAVVLVALLLVALEREPDDPAARVALSAADHARSQTRLAGVAARAWSRAGLTLLRVSRRRYRLRWQLRRQLEPLGEAAYQGDEPRVARLRARGARARSCASRNRAGTIGGGRRGPSRGRA